MELVDNHNEQPRPMALLVTAILSYVGMGYSLLQNLISWMRGPLNEQELEQLEVEFSKSMNQAGSLDGGDVVKDLLAEMEMMTATLNNHHTLNVMTGIVFILLGLAGVTLMLKQRKIGFHMYIIYSFLASVQIYFFLKPSLLTNTMVILSLIISAIFILLYSRSLKWMK